jgi:hypothetical protein
MESSRGGVELSDSFWELMSKLNKQVGSQGFPNRHMKNPRLQWRLRFPYMESDFRLGPLCCRPWLAAIHLWWTPTLEFPRFELLPFRDHILPICWGPTDLQDVVPFTKTTTDWLQRPVQWYWNLHLQQRTKSKWFLCKASKCQQGTGFVVARKTKILEGPKHQNVGFQVVEGWGAPHTGDG